MNFVIEMRNITKSFPGIVANDDITLQLKKGEIHALLGENGAGKSTLMSVLFGMYRPEKGDIYKNGEKVDIGDPNAANHLGIGMVHQHFKLVHNFTVLENIILGVESTSGGFLQMKSAREKVVQLSERYGLLVDPDAKVEDITVGQQQRVEILKMLYRNNEILIFDEPTAVLTPQEIIELMKIMKGLASEGKSILFITHKLDEIKEAADRCTVLRKGKCIGTVDVNTMSKEDLSAMMVGSKVNLVVAKTRAKPGELLLDVNGLVVKSRMGGVHAVKNVSFKVHAGEIVCIAGVDGNGQSELVRALAGLTPINGGEIKLRNEKMTTWSIRKRNTSGIGHIPEDRHKHGLVLDFPLGYNLVLQSYFKPQFCKAGFLRYDEIFQYADGLIEKYDIRTGQGSHTATRSMSGGNQQKAIVAREIDRDPDVLIAVQPTRGLDVGAIDYIHRQLVSERDAGKGILLVSLELDEVMNLSDRILVMHAGEFMGELDPKETTIQELGLYMAGSKRKEA